MRYGCCVLSKEGKGARPPPQFCNFRNPTFKIVRREVSGSVKRDCSLVSCFFRS